MSDKSGYDCAHCGERVEVGADWLAARKRDHKTFNCPKGHPNWFPSKERQTYWNPEPPKPETRLRRVLRFVFPELLRIKARS